MFIPDLENSHFVVNQMDEVTEAMECTIIKKGKEYRFSVSAGAAMTGKKSTHTRICVNMRNTPCCRRNRKEADAESCGKKKIIWHESGRDDTSFKNENNTNGG